MVYEEDGSAHFYGGKTRSVEKNTRVRARVVAQAIRELIETSDFVLVMGHEREDYDSIGSAIGVAHMARLLGKPVHVVISHQTEAIERIESAIRDVPEFKDLLITAEMAEAACNEQTLLFIVDTHRPDMTVAPKLLEKTERRVVIDHHRRSSDFIQKPLLTYMEPSSSSTSELVTELLQYFDDDIESKQRALSAQFIEISRPLQDYVLWKSGDPHADRNGNTVYRMNGTNPFEEGKIIFLQFIQGFPAQAGNVIIVVIRANEGAWAVNSVDEAVVDVRPEGSLLDGGHALADFFHIIDGNIKKAGIAARQFNFCRSVFRNIFKVQDQVVFVIRCFLFVNIYDTVPLTCISV